MARERSTRAHKQVLDAALRLFAERGIDATSMDAISEASSVSKATIYKHWADKDALCLEVLGSLTEELPEFNSGDVRKDIVDLLSYRPPEELKQMQERLFPHLMAYFARNPEFAKAWRAQILEPKRARLVQSLKHGVAAGALPADLDIGLSVALLIGPMIYSKVMPLDKTKLPEKMPERVVEAFWKAYAVPHWTTTPPKSQSR